MSNLNARSADPSIRRHVLILLCAVALLIAGCNDNAPEPAANQPDAAETPPNASAAELLQTTASAPQDVTAQAFYKLLRYLDYWHAGGVPQIAVEIQASGLAMDHTGQSLEMGLAEWKGIMEIVQTSPNGYLARAMPSDMYRDGLGEVTRQTYMVFIETPTRLLFRLER